MLTEWANGFLLLVTLKGPSPPIVVLIVLSTHMYLYVCEQLEYSGLAWAWLRISTQESRHVFTRSTVTVFHHTATTKTS